jgi:hypothetical protein
MIGRHVHLFGLPALLLALSLGHLGLARACSLDNVPSISANGMLARLNTVRPVVGHLAHWAPFVLPVAFRTGAGVRLSENLADLRKSLLTEDFSKPWRWDFGDGTGGSGFTVQHAYKKPGTYRVIVSAYDSKIKFWFQFDAALIPIH